MTISKRNFSKKSSKKLSKRISKKSSKKRLKKGGSESLYADKVEKCVLDLEKEHFKVGSPTYWKFNGMKKKYYNKSMDDMNKMIIQDPVNVLKKSKGLIAKVTRTVYTKADDSPNYKRHGIYFILSIIIFKLDKKTGKITKENHSSSSVNWKEKDFHITIPHEKLVDKLVELTIEKKFTATSLLGVSLDVAIKDLEFSKVEISNLYIPLK